MTDIADEAIDAYLDHLAEEVCRLDLNGLDEQGVEEAVCTVIGHLDTEDDMLAVLDRAERMQRERAEALRADADLLRRLSHLGRATGCPDGANVVLWLLERGLVEVHNGVYRLTRKAGALRPVE